VAISRSILYKVPPLVAPGYLRRTYLDCLLCFTWLTLLDLLGQIYPARLLETYRLSPYDWFWSILHLTISQEVKRLIPDDLYENFLIQIDNTSLPRVPYVKLFLLACVTGSTNIIVSWLPV